MIDVGLISSLVGSAPGDPVRLKGGDPFVLGRGEEALALAKVGVPIEVIPGVSSAIAAPVLSGIPLTHSGLSSGFVVVAAHAAESFRPVLEPLAPNSLTVFVLMGRVRRTTIASLLVVCGWRTETPAAIAVAASTDEAFTWIATLDRLNTLLVFYSNDGRRSLDKASYFRAYGFTRARGLTGGLAAWDAEVGREAIPRGWKSSAQWRTARTVRSSGCQGRCFAPWELSLSRKRSAIAKRLPTSSRSISKRLASTTTSERSSGS